MTAPNLSLVSGGVAKPAPTLLLSERGGPVPPADVLERMHRHVSPNIGLRFMADLDQSRWAITWEWPEHDARWARVRSQEISRESAYDIIGYLPIGCSVAEAVGYVERSLKSYPKDELRRLYAKVQHWNDVELPAQQTQDVVADTLDGLARSQRKKNPRRTRIA